MNGNKQTDLDALSRNLKRYRLVLDTMKHGVQENDCDGTITYSNLAHHKMLGYGNAELLGKKIWDVQPSLVAQEELKQYLDYLVKEQPEPQPYRTQSLRKDGIVLDLQIDWNYERDDTGKLIGFISIITDITEQNETQQQLKQRSEAQATLLDVSKNLTATLDLQTILQSAVDGVVQLVSLDTAAVYLLEDNQLYLRATTPPLPDQFPNELRIASLDDHPHIKKAIILESPIYVKDFMSTEKSEAERIVAEQRNLRSLLFIPLIAESRALGVFIVGSVGQPKAISETETDSSQTLANLAALTIKNAQLYNQSQDNACQLEQTLIDRIKSEQEREELQAQLTQSQKIESIGRLAGGIAHDFNNMLSVILGYTELALEKINSGHPLHHDLTQIHHAAQRSARLTHQLLAFARRQNVSPRIVNMNQVIKDMLEMLRRLIGEDIDLVWNAGENIRHVKIDPSQVDQILTNLCVNARDAISGVGKVTIETTNIDFDEDYCSQHPGFIAGSYVMLAISDNGIGMDEETQNNVFEPYYSTKKSGKGTGLGLSMVYGIVKQNQGFINVYSEPKQGTTFRIYFAGHESDDIEIEQKEETQQEQRGDETILLVEDEATILQMGKRMLESLGYKVLSTNNPNVALMMAREYKGSIDLLITDVVMPEMNGRDLAEQIESIFSNIKTLYISGYTANVIAHRGILHEGVMFLSKPFSTRELAEKIREVLD